MRIGRVGIVVVGILLAPTVASADGHRAGFFAGFSIARGSTLKGFHLAGDWSPSKFPPKLKYLYFEGDFSWHKGDHDGTDVTRITGLGGVRLSLGHPLTQVAGVLKRHAFSYHTLVGGAGRDGSKDFTTAIGGAYDFVTNHNAPSLGFRAQYDYLIRTNKTENFHRFSVGLVWRVPQ